HRVYKRSKETFGKNVLGLHHGGGRPQVQELLKQFHAGTKDNFEFLLDLDGRKIYISFYAVHDENGKYLGCFDFTGDITELQQMKET
ncbi:histidine kinase, partial [Streptococcus thermophilus]|nr:histidine kinase [Streptococcus thermophilus]